MELPDWVAEKMLVLTPTESLILVRLFRLGTPSGEAVTWTNGGNALVARGEGEKPAACEDAVAEALKQLENHGYISFCAPVRRLGQKGRPPRAITAPVDLPGTLTPKKPLEVILPGKSPGEFEPEPPRVRERVPFAAAAADPNYPGILRVFRIEGVLDPETQISAFGAPAALAAISELRVRRRTNTALTGKPRDVLCYFGEKYRRDPPVVPNPAMVLADWDDPEGEPERLRMVR